MFLEKFYVLDNNSHTPSYWSDHRVSEYPDIDA